MTALTNWDMPSPSGSDAGLATAAAAGDTRAFAGIYDRYADRLHDYCVGMLADRDGAADCVQDVFCIAATRLPQLRDPDKLRPWLYSIARNEALRRINERRRETPSDDMPDSASDDPGPDTLAARTELAALVSDAAGGLSDRDRAVLELAFRHGLGGPDLAEALGVTATNANTIVHRLRETIERSLGALLVSRRVRNVGGCAELATILDGWDGHFNVLIRKRISRHIESCSACDTERRRLVSPVALLGAAPVFIPAPAWLRDRTLREVELTSASGPIPDNKRNHGYALPAGLFLGALIAAMAVVFVWLNDKEPPATPAQVGTTTSAPAPQAPSAPSVSPPIPVVAPPTTTVRAAPPAPSTSAPSPVAEPPSAPPPVEPPVVPPVAPPVPPAPPAAPWPDWVPQWTPAPPAPPPGGGLTGPGDLAIPDADPPAGGSAVP